MTSLARVDDVFVLDTKALINHLIEHRKLGSQAREVFSAAERGLAVLIVSPIVVAELYYTNKKQSLFPDFQKVYSEIKSQPQFLFVTTSVDDIKDFMLLETVPEMHDRIIVGHARRLSVPLVTNDRVIQASGSVETIW